MKKLLGLALAAVMLMSFTACSDNTDVDDSFQDFVPTRGTYSEDHSVYTNESTGMKIEVPSGWYVYTDDEVAQTFLTDVTGEELASWTEEDCKNKTIIPDTAMLDRQSGDNLNLQYENLGAENAKSVTIEEYYERTKERLQNSYDYTFGDIETVTFSGIEFSCVEAEGTVDGQEFTQYFAISRRGDYLIVIVCTTLIDTPAETFYGMFK